MAKTDELIKYHPSGSVQILMDNILTTDQVISPGMLMLKAEGIHYDVIQALEIWDQEGYLYIKIRDNKTSKIGTLIQRIGVDYFVWTLISYEYLASRFLNKDFKMGMEIEFDF